MPAQDSILKILGRPRAAEELRWMTYVLARRTERGVLLLHNLTRELLLVTEEEYAHPEAVPALRERWFRVPRQWKDKNSADQVRFVLKTMGKRPEHITSYSIFTTTDCNARCFYCFEMGRSRVPMEPETARKAAAYIAGHCGGETVRLGWFGGEPLMNQPVISLICQELENRGIRFYSTMMSNGYLFDEAAVEQAKGLWRLRQVQITLDGTETVYNRCKAYQYENGKSPYGVVMENLRRLLEAKIRVAIRLNMDRHNAEDLTKLVEELHHRFGSYENLTVYSHLLFELAGDKPRARGAEDRRRLTEQQNRLQEQLKAYGLNSKPQLSRRLRLNQCMADSGRSLTILPGGELGLCDHFSEDHFVGSLDREELDEAVMQSFRETWEALPECSGCFAYPDCIRLKQCRPFGDCYPETREQLRSRTLEAMWNTYLARERQQEDDNTEFAPC